MMMEDTEKKKTVWTHQEQPIYNSKTEERIVKYVEGKASCNNWMSIQLIEKVFYNLGRILVKYPLLCIGLILIIPSLSSIGLMNYKTENNPYKLWIPQDSDYLKNHEWLWEKFPPDLRFHSVIVTGDNVLTADTLKLLLHIHRAVANTTSVDGFNFRDVCYKVPFIDLEPIAELLNDDYDYDYDEEFRRKRSVSKIIDDYEYYDKHDGDDESDMAKRVKRSSGKIDLGFDPSIDLYPTDYCHLIQDLTEDKCLENSLLELWTEDNYGEETDELLDTITEEEIIRAVNSDTYSKVLGYDQDFTKFLGGIERNASGHIVAAKATFIRFFGKVNISAITKDDRSSASKGSPVDQYSLRWETSLIETLTKGLGNHSGYDLFPNVAKSFNDLSAEAIEGDAFIFGCGTAIMFIYVQLMLGKFNFVEQRPGLSMVGIACCFLGLLTSYGICSGVGLVFSPMHAIIPFLFVGIGIDDMFVIVQCHANIVKNAGDKSHLEIMSLTLKEAGVAITITSITNIIVFAVGAVTVLPALQSFCVYCAVGIAAIYLYQATIFFAAMSIDQKRIDGRRNGLLPCIKHKNWEPNAVSKRNFAQEIFVKLAKYQLHWAGKLVVILVTLGIGSVGVWGLTMLRQEFNPVWFIPQESYLAQWFHANEKYFPKEGETVKINIAQIDYSNELPKLDALVSRLEEETSILTNVDSWYRKFKEYTVTNNLVNETYGWFDVFREDKNKFYRVLTQFLFSSSGAKYRGNFNFMQDLVCGEQASEIMLSSIELTHRLFSGPSEWIPAMNKIKQIVAEAGFSNRSFPVGTEYASWETDEVIEGEFWRNMGISLLCVFITTVVLIQNIPACIMVLVCVVFTLVNVGGFIHFWGLTIDVVSCINLIIAVGLCVDYSAHIAHNFMGHKGSGDERSMKTLRDMGPAVLNGGFSTFLAFILTASSTSHVFSTFFKIFFLVALFGMYHALIFLPVLLSIFGFCLQSHSEKNNTNDVPDVNEIPKPTTNVGVDNIEFIPDEKH